MVGKTKQIELKNSLAKSLNSRIMPAGNGVRYVEKDVTDVK